MPVRIAAHHWNILWGYGQIHRGATALCRCGERHSAGTTRQLPISRAYLDNQVPLTGRKRHSRIELRLSTGSATWRKFNPTSIRSMSYCWWIWILPLVMNPPLL